MNKEKIAFVAMKFESDVWSDKKYSVISEVLEEAGYESVRADGIRTSGISMAEVEELLREAKLIVVDISNYSPNVSYELGFCHGAGREREDIILLCKEGSEVPFNYAHYRRNQYRDIRHLRTVLRRRLGVSMPLGLDQAGYAFNFSYEKEPFYGEVVAKAIVSALRSMSFSGRCEYYAADVSSHILPSNYIVGLALRIEAKRKTPDLKWWDKLSNYIQIELEESGCEMDNTLSEIAFVRAMRHDLLDRGVAEFSDGIPVALLNRHSADSWFSGVVEGRLS